MPKIPPAVLYLEDVLGELAHYCENIEVTWQGQVRPPKGCSCVSCHFAAGIDKMLTAEWEARCGKANGTLPRSAGDAAVGEPSESREPQEPA